MINSTQCWVDCESDLFSCWDSYQLSCQKLFAILNTLLFSLQAPILCLAQGFNPNFGSCESSASFQLLIIAGLLFLAAIFGFIFNLVLHIRIMKKCLFTTVLKTILVFYSKCIWKRKRTWISSESIRKHSRHLPWSWGESSS